MNVTVPFQTNPADYDQHNIAFYIIILFMILFSIFGTLLLRRRRLF